MPCRVSIFGMVNVTLPTESVRTKACHVSSNTPRLVEKSAACGWSRAVTVFRAQGFLVELAHACLRQRFNKQDLLWNGELRDRALLAVREDVSLDVLLAHRRRGLRISHDERQCALSPIGHL